MGRVTLVKRNAERLISRLGYSIIPHWQVNDLALARHMRKTFELCEIDCVLDVGANKGQFARFVRQRVGFDGPILSFEPVTSNYLKLQEECHADENRKCFQMALGASAGKLNINVMNENTFSSFLKPRDVQPFIKTNAIKSSQQTIVERLDTWMESQNLPYHRFYLKMDTQGFDLEVFRGATGVLDRIPALQCELSFLPIYDEMPNYQQMLDFVGKYDYRVSNMFLVTMIKGEAVEMDCVMVRKDKGQ